MKYSFLYSFLGVSILLLCSLYCFAVAPMPGLDLEEPYRPFAPFEILSHDAKNNIQRVAPRKVPELNMAPRGLLILVNFQDAKFAKTNTTQAFDSLANGSNYTYNGATGSCKTYFTDQSNGKYIPHFDVVGPVTLPHDIAYYGTNDQTGNDQYIVDFVIDACLEADKLGIDFSQYDNNNDGKIDFVYIIYAGYAESEGAPASTIWPHNWDLVSALYYGCTNQDEYYANSNTDYHLPQIDGKMLYSYACSNELKKDNSRTGIGIICHEFCHVLGLPDYYLTVSSDPYKRYGTPGNWSLMGSGNYLNNGNTPPNFSVYDKYFLGWIEPTALSQNQQLEIPADGTTTYMLARNEQHVEEGPYRTDTVYYIENRQKEGWDTYLPGNGMLIWRVIFDEKDWFNNCPNDYITRYMLISAKQSSYPYTTGKDKPEVPFPGSSNVTKYAPFSHNGLENIQENDGIITCNFHTTSTSLTNHHIIAPDDKQGIWYNILGLPIHSDSYQGVVIKDGKKYLLR